MADFILRPQLVNGVILVNSVIEVKARLLDSGTGPLREPLLDYALLL